jgi:DNA phosphorothioation-associated putative methyltransferase
MRSLDASTTVGAERTAINRPSLSRPVSLAMADGLIASGRTVFDYGCGRGGDVERLEQLGVSATGWDPAFFADRPLLPADVVNLGYIVNVIEAPAERLRALTQAWELARDLLIVSARMEWEARALYGAACGDGVVTTRGTFQKFFTHEELRDWIDASLGVRSVAAAPGIFYVFRDPTKAETFFARRSRTRATPLAPRVSEQLFAANRELLEPLVAFVTQHARVPDASEIEEAAEIGRRFGSIGRAFAVVRSITGSERWDAIRLDRQRDLLVYIALGAFRGRPRFGHLPADLQRDIKAFFGTYSRACGEADALLYATGNREALDLGFNAATVGKLTAEALYVHVTALDELPPVLRVYEGCAQVIAGRVPDATIVKLRRDKPKISYLAYPDFDEDPHPALAESVIADLKALHVYHRDYRSFSNPPVLHRKETFVSVDYPGREKFAKLTAQEEKAGLFSDAASIGTRDGWRALLDRFGLETRGHRLMRKRSTSTDPVPIAAHLKE